MDRQLAEGQAAPLVGRTRDLAAIADALERSGCVISGAPGVGKTRLAAEAAARRGGPAVRVAGTAAASSIPFGAFAPLLADVPADPRGPIARCLAELGQRWPDRPPTLVVDDAHWLDDASAALLLAIADSGAARLLVTLRDGEPVPDALTALWKDGHLHRLDLGPLPRRELRRLVETQLGGRVDPDVHAEVHSLTEGNPLYARELLIDACRSGALGQRDGWWRWTGRPPELHRLRELIGARTGDLTAGGRSALEVLAVGAPLRLNDLEALAGEQSVGELEDADLAVVRGEPNSLSVELAHPLFGEVTLDEMPVATARRHRRRLAEVLRAREPTDRLGVLRLATLLLDAGEQDPTLFLRAAALAIEVQAGVPGPGWGDADPTLAVRLADAAGPGLDAALAGARARVALNRFADAAAHLAPYEGAAAEAPLAQAAEYLRTRANALHWSGQTPQVGPLLDRAWRWRDEPDWAALHATLRAWVLHDTGRPRGASSLLRALPDLERVSAPLRLETLLVLALTESRLGLTGHCEALEPQIEQLVIGLERASVQTGWARYLVDGYARAESARDLRDTEARLSEARERAEESGDLALAAALSMVLGRLLLSRGRCDEAIELLEDAVQSLTTGDPRNALGWALCHLARAHALAGDTERADEAATQAEAVVADRPLHLRLALETRRVRAWVDATTGRLTSARNRLLEIADAAGEALLCEAEALYDALRFGAPASVCAERLATLAGSADSDLLDACAAHAAAVASAEVSAQLQAAERFSALGLDLYAAEAANKALGHLAASGGPSGRVTALAARYAQRCPGVTTPILATVPTVDPLTPRELEIARLAAEGLRNTDIAEELVLSVRTVETYILRACSKLGVKSRTDLARALRGPRRRQTSVAVTDDRS